MERSEHHPRTLYPPWGEYLCFELFTGEGYHVRGKNDFLPVLIWRLNAAKGDVSGRQVEGVWAVMVSLVCQPDQAIVCSCLIKLDI